MLTDHRTAIVETNLARSSEPDNPVLDAFVTKTQVPLDVIALFTAWFFLVPSKKLREVGISPGIEIAARAGFLFLFLGHFIVCVGLSHDRKEYVRSHPLGFLAGLFPPVRFLLSLGILRWVFRRGHVEWFLAIAAVILGNLTIVMFLYEKDASGTTIKNIGDAVWCSMATVTTVGYGDNTPVTFGGRFAAGLIMALGIITLAVITATVSSAFVDQARAARAEKELAGEDLEPEEAEDAVDEMLARLARIEAMLDNLDAAGN